MSDQTSMRVLNYAVTPLLLACIGMVFLRGDLPGLVVGLVLLVCVRLLGLSIRLSGAAVEECGEVSGPS